MNATGPVECGILQEHAGGSGDSACRWSSAFYAIVILTPVVVLTVAAILTAVLCRRRQLNRQDQENVEAKTVGATDVPPGETLASCNAVTNACRLAATSQIAS